MAKRTSLGRELTPEEQIVQATSRRVAAAKRTRLIKCLVFLVIFAAVIYFGGRSLANYMWGTP
jgi:ammonia channel protein AmtB